MKFPKVETDPIACPRCESGDLIIYDDPRVWDVAVECRDCGNVVRGLDGHEPLAPQLDNCR